MFQSQKVPKLLPNHVPLSKRACRLYEHNHNSSSVYSAEPPLKHLAFGNQPPKMAPKPHVPKCSDPNQPLESSPITPSQYPRKSLRCRRLAAQGHRCGCPVTSWRREQPLDLGGWGGAVFDGFDGTFAPICSRAMRLMLVFSGSVGCDIDQIDAGPGGVTMEQFQRIYVQQR